MNGQLCTECGTPHAPGGTPDCPCAALAMPAAHAEWAAANRVVHEAAAELTTRAAHDAQAARTAEMVEQRTAEAAAAEDFDPLRIRPYVTLDREEPPTTDVRTAGPLPPLAPRQLPSPGALPDRTTSRRRASRRPAKVLTFGVTAVAVLGTAAFAGGLLSHTPHTDQALGDTLHSDLADEGSLPDGMPAPNPKAPQGSSTLSPSSPSPSVSVSSTPHKSAPGTSSTTVRHPAIEQVHAESVDGLRLGDSGARVVDLQQRLAALYLYHGPADGHYDQGVATSVRIYQAYRHIQGDPPGVYGAATRHALEAEEAPHAQTPHTPAGAQQQAPPPATPHHGGGGGGGHASPVYPAAHPEGGNSQGHTGHRSGRGHRR